ERAGLDRAKDVVIIVVRGQNDDLGRGREAFDLADGCNTIHPGHQQIEQYDLRYEICRLSDSLLSIAAFTYNRNIRLAFQHKAQSLPYDGVVINNQNANH